MQLYMQRWHGQEKRSNRSRTLIFLILSHTGLKHRDATFSFLFGIRSDDSSRWRHHAMPATS